MRLTDEDQRRVSEAVTRAEAGTDGEIATIVALRSDPYLDVAGWWALLVTLGVLALIAALPDLLTDMRAVLSGGWAEAWSLRSLLTTLLVLLVLVFAGVRLMLGWWPLRLALTPRAITHRRVREEALRAFRIGTEARTAARNGVLLYLSLAEHRAEIVADSGIHARVAPEEWGEAMAALLGGVKAGRPGEGMAAAVERIGAVLALHFPRTGGDPNELPDRVIAL